MRRGIQVAGVLVAVASVFVLAVSDERGPDEPDSVAFQMGRELLTQPSPEARASAVPYFRSAIEEAPNYAAAHTGLAESLYWAGDLEGARTAAHAALELRDEDPRALLVLGTAALSIDWNWVAAESYLRAAVRALPTDPDPGVALAYLLVTAGRSVEATEVLDRTSALEPASASVTGDLGALYGWLGAHRRALDLCERTIAVAPQASWGHMCALGAAHALNRAEDVRARATSLLELSGAAPESVLAADVETDSDVHDLHRHLLATDSFDSHFARAVALATVGDHQQAVEALRLSASTREAGVVAIAAHPALKVLVGIPAYDALRAQVFAVEDSQRAAGG